MSQESNLYKQFIDWKNLGNWSEPLGNHYTSKAQNPLCGDEIVFYFERDSDSRIRVLGLGGESCSVCEASAGLLFHRKQNFFKVEVEKEIDKFLNYLETEVDIEFFNEAEKEFWNLIKKTPNRLRCATLPFKALVRCCEEV